MQISIIIPTYNGIHLLATALPPLITLLDQVPEQTQLIFVDNGSSDGSVKYLTQAAKHDDRITVIALDSNRGFTGAVNAGAKAANGSHLLLLNNDCQIEAEALQKLIAASKGTPKSTQITQEDSLASGHRTKVDHGIAGEALSAVQPIVQSPDGAIENAGFVMDKRIAKAYPITDLTDSRLNDPALHRWDDQQPQFVGLSATCLLIDRAVFVRLGWCDESFHSYLEDVDLSIRLARAGCAYAVVSDATAVHQHMATSSKMGRYKQTRDLLNWIRIITKHYSPTLLLANAGPLLFERLRNLNGWLKG